MAPSWSRVAWDLRQSGEVQGGDAHVDGGLAFRWAPTGRLFATTGRLGEVRWLAPPTCLYTTGRLGEVAVPTVQPQPHTSA